MKHVSKPLARSTAVALLILSLGASLLAVAAPAQAQKVDRTFFGIHDGQVSSGSVPKVPLGSIRLWDSGTSWREIETQPPTPPLLPTDPVQYHYDFSKLDVAISNAWAAGMRPMVVLGQTPQFYAENPAASSSYGPGASSMPRSHLDAWQNYAYTLGARYGTAVDYQIWNEPSLPQFWSASPADMATMTALATPAIESGVHVKEGSSANPTVVSPGFPLRLSPQRTWFKQFWAQQVNGSPVSSYVDVVALHLYPLASAGPEASMALLKQGRALLPAAARAKPEWNTEVNYGLQTGGGGTAKPITSSKQSAYVARTLLLNGGSPISRMYWYAWAQGRIANTHLVTDDRSTLTAAGKTWQRVYAWMIGTSMGSCSMIRSGASKGVWSCTAKKSRKETRRFYWKPNGRAAPITTVRTTQSWTSLKGRVTKRKGSYTLKVGSSPVMVTSRR